MKKICILLIIILITGCGIEDSKSEEQLDIAKEIAYKNINSAKSFIKQYEVDNDKEWNNAVTFTFDNDSFRGIINGKRYEIISYGLRMKSGSLYLDKNGDVTIIEPLIIDNCTCESVGKFVECK